MPPLRAPRPEDRPCLLLRPPDPRIGLASLRPPGPEESWPCLLLRRRPGLCCFCPFFSASYRSSSSSRPSWATALPPPAETAFRRPLLPLIFPKRWRSTIALLRSTSASMEATSFEQFEAAWLALLLVMGALSGVGKVSQQPLPHSAPLLAVLRLAPTVLLYGETSKTAWFERWPRMAQSSPSPAFLKSRPRRATVGPQRAQP